MTRVTAGPEDIGASWLTSLTLLSSKIVFAAVWCGSPGAEPSMLTSYLSTHITHSRSTLTMQDGWCSTAGMPQLSWSETAERGDSPALARGGQTTVWLTNCMLSPAGHLGSLLDQRYRQCRDGAALVHRHARSLDSRGVSELSQERTGGAEAPENFASETRGRGSSARPVCQIAAQSQSESPVLEVEKEKGASRVDDDDKPVGMR